MQFTVKDYLFTACVVTVIATVSLLIVRIVGFVFVFLPVSYKALANVSVFVITFLFLLGGVYPKILRWISPFKDAATFSSNDKTLYCFVWKQTVFTYEWTASILCYVIPVILRGVFYRILGARIGRNVLIAGKIVEPQMVEIGQGSIVGDTSLLMAHAMDKETVILKRIVLGRNTTVGAHAIVMPGVQIGDNSIVAAGSVVPMDTIIPPGEVWGGMPARKIKELSP